MILSRDFVRENNELGLTFKSEAVVEFLSTAHVHLEVTGVHAFELLSNVGRLANTRCSVELLGLRLLVEGDLMV